MTFVPVYSIKTEGIALKLTQQQLFSKGLSNVAETSWSLNLIGLLSLVPGGRGADIGRDGVSHRAS